MPVWARQGQGIFVEIQGHRVPARIHSYPIFPPPWCSRCVQVSTGGIRTRGRGGAYARIRDRDGFVVGREDVLFFASHSRAHALHAAKCRVRTRICCVSISCCVLVCSFYNGVGRRVFPRARCTEVSQKLAASPHPLPKSMVSLAQICTYFNLIASTLQSLLALAASPHPSLA